MRRERTSQRTLCLILTGALCLVPAVLWAADSGEDVKQQATDTKATEQEASKKTDPDEGKKKTEEESKPPVAKAADPSLKTIEEIFASPVAASTLLEEPKPEESTPEVKWRKAK